ncbi:hypothetical protein BS47DRAFT_1310038, partial [Hydnum rufescens UP504]
VVSMPNLRIIDYVLGPTGSMHDSSSFELSSIAQDPWAWFLEHEWIWADSAYGLAPWCIVPYKRPFSLVESNEKFNYYLSKIRIKSEHVMGMLKGRFSSLRGLCQQITEPRDHLLALKWIESCLILHNLILDIEQGSEDDDEFTARMLREGMSANGEDGHDIDFDEIVVVGRISPGEWHRCELKAQLLDSLDFENV